MARGKVVCATQSRVARIVVVQVNCCSLIYTTRVNDALAKKPIGLGEELTQRLPSSSSSQGAKRAGRFQHCTWGARQPKARVWSLRSERMFSGEATRWFEGTSTEHGRAAWQCSASQSRVLHNPIYISRHSFFN